jgi:hypothetical protein
MGAQFVSLDAGSFESFFQRLGFARSLSNYEVVYSKPYESFPQISYKVFTSIREGDPIARDVGKDAVRVVAILTSGNKTYPIFRGKRIHRTTSQESVEGRIFDRLNEATKRCGEWCAEQNAKRSQIQSASSPGSDETGEPEHHADASPGHVGRLGDTLRLVLTISSRKEYNGKFLFTMKDNEGHQFIYWTEKDLLKEKEMYDIRAKITGYNTFRDIKQTILSECAGKRVIQ